jgi:hypothetical protein
MRRAFAVLVALSATSCFAVTDLDRFQTSNGPQSNFSDLRLTVRGMVSHVNELFEYRVVDSTNTIQSRGLAIPLGGPDATFFIPGAIPRQNGPFHLDFYGDHDRSGRYTPPSAGAFLDHSWRIELPQPNDQNLVELVFDHNTSFTNLEDPAPPKEYGKLAKIHLVNLGPFQGKRIEIRISDASSKRVVALFRNPALARPDFDATVPGMIEEGVTYDVEVYTDDGTGAPGSVTAFRFQKESDAGGLAADFDPATAPRVTDALPP